MKQKPGIATRTVLLVVSLLWAIPLIWSVLTALKPSKESMLLQLPSTLTLENFQVVFESAPFLQYGTPSLSWPAFWRCSWLRSRWAPTLWRA